MDTRIKQLLLILTTTTLLLLSMFLSPLIIGITGIALSVFFYFVLKIRYYSIATAVLALMYAIELIPAIAYLGPLMMIVWGEAFIAAFQKHYHPLTFFFIGSLLALVLTMLYVHDLQPLIIVLAVLVLLMLRSILKDRSDGSMIALIGTAATITLFEDLKFFVDNQTLAVAVVICIAFGYFAYKAKTIDMSGVFAAALFGVILISFGNVMWFFIVLAFFILGSMFTKYRYARKEALGVNQSKKGVRGYMNAFGNVGVGIIAAILYGVSGNVLFAALFVGSIATATADTLASEIGVLSTKTPRMITNLKPCEPGTNGGVTLTGELACLAGSAVISLMAISLNVVPWYIGLICIPAGFIGTNIDSLIGALVENRGLVGNSGTNLIATLLGGLVALGLSALVIMFLG